MWCGQRGEVVHESQARWRQDQPSKSVSSWLSSELGEDLIASHPWQLSPPPSHVPRAQESNEEHVHTGKQICDFRRQ